jgi:hypothetical protein
MGTHSEEETNRADSVAEVRDWLATRPFSGPAPHPDPHPRMAHADHRGTRSHR